MLSKRLTYKKSRPRGLFLLLCLAGLILCSVSAPAVGAAELKAELVNKVREGRSAGFMKSLFASTGAGDLVAAPAPAPPASQKSAPPAPAPGGSAEALCNQGLQYASERNYEKALEAFKEAIRLKPDFASAHLNLGLTYLDLGNKAAALEEYKILQNLDPERAKRLSNKIYR